MSNVSVSITANEAYAESLPCESCGMPTYDPVNGCCYECNHDNAEAYADEHPDIVDGTYRSSLSVGPDFTISLVQHDQYWIENVSGYVTTVVGAEARELVALGHWELVSEDTNSAVWTCDSQGTWHKEEVATAWNARLAARAAAIVSAAGGLALALSLLFGTPASAQTLPLVPTDGECVITHQFEDGSATALCGHDTWAFDADGGYVVDNGIVFFYRDPGTWYQVR
jgi:hypothetical protein